MKFKSLKYFLWTFRHFATCKLNIGALSYCESTLLILENRNAEYKIESEAFCRRRVWWSGKTYVHLFPLPKQAVWQNISYCDQMQKEYLVVLCLCFYHSLLHWFYNANPDQQVDLSFAWDRSRFCICLRLICYAQEHAQKTAISPVDGLWSAKKNDIFLPFQGCFLFPNVRQSSKIQLWWNSENTTVEFIQSL